MELPAELHLGTVRLQVSAIEEDFDITLGDSAPEKPATTGPKVVLKTAAPAHAPPPPTPAKNKEVAGHYTKGRELARGGMGAILEADDQLLGRTVAMKVILGREADEDARLRFIREATVLARLEHPNIVPIHEMGKDADGNLFYTMKMVAGDTLQAIIKDLRAEKPETVAYYTLDRLLTIFRKVCDALAFAHSKGVVHRDLKPENIMVGAFGEVLVMDWGLAKILDDSDQAAAEEQRATAPPMPAGFEELSDAQLQSNDTNLTMDGQVMGSPQYMSPEQAQGRVAEVVESSDIFSLGGVLYALLTLRPPVEGRTLRQVLDNVKTGNIRPPTDHNPAVSSAKASPVEPSKVSQPDEEFALPHCPAGRVPTALSAVCMKALAVDPADRFPAVGEFAADIESYQGGFATSAETIGFIGQLALLIRRHKGIAISVAAAIAVILVLSSGFVMRLNTEKLAAQESEREARAAEVVAEKAKEVAVQKEKETSRALARSALSLAEAALREADAQAMQSALEDVPKDLRDNTWTYLLSRANSSLAVIRTATNMIEGVAAHPKQPGVFAVADRSHMLSLIDVRGPEKLWESKITFGRPSKFGLYRVAFSRNGERIAIGRESPGGIVIYDSSDGRKVKAWNAPPTERLEFGSRGKLLQQEKVQPYPGLTMWNAAKGTKMWSAERQNRGPGIGCQGIFTPDGNAVITYTTADRLRILRGSDGGVARELGGEMYGYFWRMAVNPDGRSIFVSHEKGRECISLEDGSVQYGLPLQRKREMVHVHYSADGTQVVTATEMNDGRQAIEVWNARTGELLRKLLGGQGTAVGLSIHPLSDELLITGANARAWDLVGQPPNWSRDRPDINRGGDAVPWGNDLIFGRPGPREGSEPWGLFQPDGDRLRTIWEAPNGDRRDYVAEVSKDGKVAAITLPGFNPSVWILKNQGPEPEMEKLTETNFKAFRLRIAADGGTLALMKAIDKIGLEIISTSTGRITVKPDLKGVIRINDLAFLGSNRIIGLATTGQARGNSNSQEELILWNSDNGAVIQRRAHPSAMDSLALAPSGQKIAEAGVDKNLRVRNAETLEIERQFRIHDGPITAIAWHPTKAMIATGSSDLTVRLWDVESRELLSERKGLLKPPSAIRFTPNGNRMIVTTSVDVRIWDLD